MHELYQMLTTKYQSKIETSRWPPAFKKKKKKKEKKMTTSEYIYNSLAINSTSKLLEKRYFQTAKVEQNQYRKTQ